MHEIIVNLNYASGNSNFLTHICQNCELLIHNILLYKSLGLPRIRACEVKLIGLSEFGNFLIKKVVDEPSTTEWDLVNLGSYEKEQRQSIA